MSHTHTYLDVVNAVLVRLREDTVSSVSGNDDVVVNLVKEFVNDAKRTVEDAHTWSAMDTEWNPSTAIGNDKLVLTDSSRTAIISYVYDSNGSKLLPMDKESFRSRALTSSANGSPQYYIVDGKESDGDVRLRVWPAPATVETYSVYGYHRTPDLVNDTDVLALPAQPVIYFAEAFAARERGEVGAQSAGELLSIAKKYLEDAIAIDATNSDMDNIWYTV